jgi:hypothetical protein
MNFKPLKAKLLYFRYQLLGISFFGSIVLSLTSLSISNSFISHNNTEFKQQKIENIARLVHDEDKTKKA